MYKVEVKVVKSKRGGYYTRAEAERAKRAIEQHLRSVGWITLQEKYHLPPLR